MSNKKIMEKMVGKKIIYIGSDGIVINIIFEDGISILIIKNEMGTLELKEVGGEKDATGGKLSTKMEVKNTNSFISKFINRIIR